MGENSDGRTVEEIKTSIQTTAAPNSTMMKNQTNTTNRPGEQGETSHKPLGSKQAFGVTKTNEAERNAVAQLLGSVGIDDEIGINSLPSVGSWDGLYTQKAGTESDEQTKRVKVGIIARGEVGGGCADRGL